MIGWLAAARILRTVFGHQTIELKYNREVKSYCFFSSRASCLVVL